MVNSFPYRPSKAKALRFCFCLKISCSPLIQKQRKVNKIRCPWGRPFNSESDLPQDPHTSTADLQSYCSPAKNQTNKNLPPWPKKFFNECTLSDYTTNLLMGWLGVLLHVQSMTFSTGSIKRFVHVFRGKTNQFRYIALYFFSPVTGKLVVIVSMHYSTTTACHIWKKQQPSKNS